MSVGCNHNVPRGVGKKVEENEVETTPVQDQVLPVSGGVPAMQLAEYAPLLLDPFTDVAKSPGTPEVIHIACRQDL